MKLNFTTLNLKMIKNCSCYMTDAHLKIKNCNYYILVQILGSNILMQILRSKIAGVVLAQIFLQLILIMKVKIGSFFSCANHFAKYVA